MTVYDTANQLAKEIKESNEYLNYKKLKKEIMGNNEKKAKIEEFEKTRYNVQLSQMNGENIEEKSQKLQELYTILVQNKDIKEYFDAEIKFNILLADVNKIIAESVKDVL